MAYDMCSSHVNDAAKKAYSVTKVKSSRRNVISEIIKEEVPDISALSSAAKKSGYRVSTFKTEPYSRLKLSLFNKKR